MRRFSSYGPVNPELHYYTPRKVLVEKACASLLGEIPAEGGHYFTVWAPRQTGKTWIMQEVLFRLRKNNDFDTLKINLEILKDRKNPAEILEIIARKIGEGLGKSFKGIDTQDKFQEIFTRQALEKPLILILDEFDALVEEGINVVVSAFRNIYINRLDDRDKPIGERNYLLHGVALIGVRSVLGIENQKGSPFNIQRSLHIPNLTFEEVEGMFRWYENESGQKVEPGVIDALFRETNGQPGLTGWFGELLTEGIENHPNDRKSPITMRDFEIVYAATSYALPNNNILNIISKVKQEANKTLVLKMFQTDEKLEFKFDNPTINALYMNGVIDTDVEDRTRYYIKFSSPFVQKRVFNYFSDEFFEEMGALVEPFVKLDQVITDTDLHIINLMRLYQAYLQKNSHWLFKSVPRRADMKIYEAVFHFNLYSYLNAFLKNHGGRVYPEFPTGNGQIDLIITYGKNRYGLELKSFTNERDYKNALVRAAKYGKHLGLPEIFLVCFVETIDEETRKRFETVYRDSDTGLTVKPVFVSTGK